MAQPLHGGLSHNTKTINIPKRKGETNTFNVTNVSQQVLGEDPNRRLLFIQNNNAIGTVTVSVGGAAAVLGVGFNLAVNGGAIMLDVNCPQDKIFIIGSIASNPNVTVVSA